MAFSSAFLSSSALKLSDAPFLFGEELYVAEVARAIGAKSYFDSRLRVFHKEHATTKTFKSKALVKLLHNSTSRILKEFY
jgi:hypothetical protein